MTARGIGLERHGGNPGSQKGLSSYAGHLRTPTARSVQQTPSETILSRVRLRAVNRADGHRAPARVEPAPIVLWVVQVGKAREVEVSSGQREAAIARNALLAGVKDAHPKQLAVIRVREGQELRHARFGSVRGDSGADQTDQQAH